jgi:HSP20 family protein
MAIVRWEPARDFASLQQDVNRVFASFFDPSAASSGAGTSRWIPPVDLEELEESFLLVADLPGVAEDDVAIDVEGDVLTLSGARTRSDASSTTIRSERGHGSFRRQLTLPEGVDAERITATFDRGVLQVEVPTPAEARPRRVSIQVGDRARTIDAGEVGDDPGEEGGAGTTARSPRGGSPEPAGATA